MASKQSDEKSIVEQKVHEAAVCFIFFSISFDAVFSYPRRSSRSEIFFLMEGVSCPSPPVYVNTRVSHV